MSTEVAKQDNNTSSLQVISDTKLVEYLDLFQSTQNLTDIEKKQFIEIAKMSNLNPFKREIYITAYGEGQYRQCSIITGYEVYIKRAEMSKLLNGWSTKVEACKAIHVNDNGSISHINDIKAIITINRKDFDEPFIHEVKFSEYVQKTKQGKVNKFWKEKPETMLKKVAISQGFRLCFNEVLGGMPYTKEELLDENQTIDISHQDVNNVDELYNDALAELSECESVSGLETIWNKYIDLHSYEIFTSQVNEAKKFLTEKEKE